MFIRPGFLKAILLAYSALAIGVFVVEFQAFSQSHPVGMGAFQLTKQALPHRLLSAQSTHAALRMCDRAMALPTSAMQPANARRTTAQSCGDLATRAIGRAPTNGYAYYVAAQAALELGARAKSARHLATSRLYAPFEGWIAARRFVLAMNPPQMNDVVLHDVAVLLTTQSGAALLAHYHHSRPEARPAIAARLPQASPEDQKRLANLIWQRKRSP